MINYAEVLADLTARRDELNAAISAITPLVGSPAPVATVIPAPRSVDQIKADRQAETDRAIEEVRGQVTGEYSDQDFVNGGKKNGANGRGATTDTTSKVGRRCQSCGQRSGGPRSKNCQHCFEPF